MDSEKDVIEMLESIGYKNIMLGETFLQKSIADGFKCEHFREFIIWITDEVRVLGGFEERVHKSEEINEFTLELSAFLKEMMCPWTSMVSGPITDRFQTHESRLSLIVYLLTELMALKMYRKLNPMEPVIIELNESASGAALKQLAIALNMGKPPINITAKALFDKINARVSEVIQKNGEKQLGQPLFVPTKQLTNDQWNTLKQYQKELEYEYNLRRKMLLTRLDVTIQSFQWSDKLKGKQDEISLKYTKSRQTLDGLQTGDKATGIPAMLAAREDLAIIEKTSSANVRKNTNTEIQKHVIGRVPDRGGRAYEHAPPPPEMPSWQQNRSGGPGGQQRGGGGGGGGGRGGYGGRGGGRGDFSGQQGNHHRGGGGGGGFNQQSGYNSQGGGGGGGYQRQFSNSSGGGGGGGGSNIQQDSYQQYGGVVGGYQQQSNNGGNFQRQNFDNRGSGAGGGGGGSRVQGNWSQQGGQSNEFNDNRQRSQPQANNQQYSRGNDREFSSRGRSNYHRGGGGGGGGARRI